MKLVTQLGDSDCFNACLSALSGIPLEAFPVLPPGSKGWQQWNAVQAVMHAHGYSISSDTFTPPRIPAGFSIGSGKSPRGDWYHSVLCHDGEFFFDPHPSRAGLAGPIESYELVVKLMGPYAPAAS